MIPGVVRAAPGCGGLHAFLKSLHAVRGGHFLKLVVFGVLRLVSEWFRVGFWRRFVLGMVLIWFLEACWVGFWRHLFPEWF